MFKILLTQLNDVNKNCMNEKSNGNKSVQLALKNQTAIVSKSYPVALLLYKKLNHPAVWLAYNACY